MLLGYASEATVSIRVRGGLSLPVSFYVLLTRLARADGGFGEVRTEQQGNVRDTKRFLVLDVSGTELIAV